MIHSIAHRFFKSLIPLLIGLVWVNKAIASPEFWVHEWPKTDFSKTEVPWVEIMSGGPGKDGIPALKDPTFVPLEEVDFPRIEPVMSIEIEGDARAYPIRYLMWHELVNDRIGDTPILVSFCPLCNSGLIFDRRQNGRELTFGVTGKLRFSDMVMYDVETQSWWQQAIGHAIVGEMTGADLTALPSRMESLQDFAKRHPDGRVMARPTYSRAYGSNPYVGYEAAPRPFLYSGDPPPHGIRSLERVIRIGSQAWPMTRLEKEDVITEAGFVISKVGRQASALEDGVIATARLIPTVEVKNSNGEDVVYDVMFAFAFDAFWPEGEWMLAP